MAALYIFITAGVRNELPHLNGLSHICEHMLFGGNRRMSGRELLHRITEKGGYINACTGRDYTLFSSLFPSCNIIDGLEIITGMLFKSQMTQQVLDREKSVIFQEILETPMRDDFLPNQIFYEEVFNSSPYGMPILGTHETLSRISLNDVANYHRKHYLPSHMRILFLGDTDKNKAERFINYFFSEKYPKFRSPEYRDKDFRFQSPPMKLRKLPSLLIKRENVEKNFLYLAMKAPGTDSPLFLPFFIFSRLIATGGRLSVENHLRSIMKEHFREFNVSYLFWKDGGLMIFRILVAPGFCLNEAMNIFFSKFCDILSKPIPESELREYLITEEAGRVYGAEKIDTYGFLKAQSFMNMKQEMFTDFPELIKTITPDRIERAAGKVVSGTEWNFLGVETGI